MGIAISTAVITGALIVGDSISYSLEQATHYRLGKVNYALTSGDRFFDQSLSYRLNQPSQPDHCSVLKLEAIAMVNGGKIKLNRTQIWGVDSVFKNVIGARFHFDSLGNNEVIISQNAADKLNLKIGDQFLLKVKKASLIPLNAPFVSSEEQSVSARVQVKAILRKEDYGRLSLNNSQTAPYNIFASIEWLNSLMELERKANLLLSSGTQLKEEDIRKVISLRDVGLQLELNEDQVFITSQRVFIDSILAHGIQTAIPNSKAIITYFVNDIAYEPNHTPYSFVSTKNDLDSNEIIINSWMADDLQAEVGDLIKLEYFEVGPLRKLDIGTKDFKIKEIIPIQSQINQSELMPKFPGMSDVGSCRDWDTGIPIDLDKIRDKDEAYWEDYRGTPKAFIGLKQAELLWSNRFGIYTSFTIEGENPETIAYRIEQIIDPFQLGFQINNVKEEGISAAKNGTDFSQLFIGLSFFIIVSGLLLTVLLFLYSLDHRMNQIGTLKAIGFSIRMIKKVFLFEMLLVSILGSALGLILSIGYNSLVFIGLNRVWQDIVRTQVLEIQINWSTLLVGFLISVLISWLTIVLSLNKTLKSQSSELQNKLVPRQTKWFQKVKFWLMILLMVTAGSIIAFQLEAEKYLSETAFFAAGSLFLIVFLLLFDFLLSSSKKVKTKRINIRQLAWRNLISNKTRSLLVIILLSIGTFLVISTGANRKDLFSKSNLKSSGTGGFDYYATSTMPILKNLSNKNIKQSYSIQDSIDIVQFRSIQGDDASCLNLNRISRPKLLGVDPDMLAGRFNFVTKTAFLDESNPWHSLDEQTNGFIPAIADQTVILWSLGKSVGDTLVYINEAGKKIYLKLIGGLGASIFQGNLLISNSNFLANYPSSSGTNVFLIEGAKNSETEYDFNLAFKDLGWEMTGTATRLAQFKSVENTYLSIFLVLGALGLLLGTIGLAIVLARSISQRKNEFSILMAHGFSNPKIYLLIFWEYFILLVLGLFGGSFTALVSVFPTLLKNQDIPLNFIGLILAILLINGIFWIGLISIIQIKRISISKNMNLE